MSVVIKKKRKADDVFKDNSPKKKRKTNNNRKKKKNIDPWKSPQFMISWLLCNKSVSIDNFFNTIFGKKQLFIRRQNASYYNQHQIKFQLKDVYQIIKQNELKFGQHIMCKKYNGNKEVQPPFIKANDNVSVNQFKKIMNKGYTIQFHHPQHFVPNIAKMLSLLESYFGVEVGCNVYITPSKTQGLAPHWDDVEVFVLQIEGKKHWEIYERTDDINKHPLQSSDDLDLKADCNDLKLLLKCDVSAGDLLYFPRGAIHFAKTIGKSHSTHLTISTNQRTTWGDFMHNLMERAMNNAIDNNIQLRQNMPMNFLSYMGSTQKQNINQNIKQKQLKFLNDLDQITNIVTNSIKDVVHQSCDDVGIDFISHRLPPVFMLNQKKNKNKSIKINETMNVCLKSVDCIRVVNEDGDGEDDEDDIDKSKQKGFKIKMIDLNSNQIEMKQNDVTSFVEDSDDDDEDVDDDKDNIDDIEEDDDQNKEFRLYSSINNDVTTHCVGFIGEENGDNVSYVTLPMYLRPIIDRLIINFPNNLCVTELNDLTVSSLDETKDLIQMLYQMKLIKLTK